MVHLQHFYFFALLSLSIDGLTNLIWMMMKEMTVVLTLPDRAVKYKD